MSKIVLNDISNITGNPTSAEQSLNDNFAKIEAAIENTFSRDGTTPNALLASVDANSHRIVNLPYALSNTEPVTLAQMMSAITGGDWTGGLGVPAVVYYQDTEPTATAINQVWVKLNGEIYIWNGVSWVRQTDPMTAYAVSQADAAVALADAASALATSASGAASGAAQDAFDASSAAASALAAAQAADANAMTGIGDAYTALLEAQAAAAAAALAQGVADQATAAIDLLEPRIIAVEADSANFSQAIIELEAEDINLAGQITTITADLGDLTSAVQTEEYARVQGDTALAQAIQNIQVANAPAVYIQASAPVPGVGGVPNPITEGSIWYDSDDGNHPYRYLNSAWVSVQDAEIAALSAAVASEQTARIDGDSALALDITALSALRDDDYALIVQNNQARIDGDSALASSISTLTTNLGTLNSTVISNDIARVNGDGALASSINGVQVSLNNTIADLDTLDTNVTNLSATVASNNSARISGDDALASSLSTVQALATTNQTNITNLSATVTTNNQARVDGDNSLAQSISIVNSTVGNLSITVGQQSSAINGIQGKYAVKIDNNGYITGYDIISQPNVMGYPSSTFRVLADRFQIFNGSTAVAPFYVEGGIVYMGNVVIGEASIGTATIDTLKIKGSAISNTYSRTFDFLGSNGPNIAVAGAYYNLTTIYGTAQIAVGQIATGSAISIRAYFNGKRWGSSGEDGRIRLIRNDGVLIGGTLNIRMMADPLIYAWEWIDTAPVSTDHTYTVQVTRPSGTGTIGAWYDIQMTAVTLKR